MRGCKIKVVARGLCQRHYQRARAAKTLPPQQLEIPLKPVHSLTNIKHGELTGDCAVCGPEIPIRVRKGRGAECGRKSRRGKNKKPLTPQQRRAYWLIEKYGLTLERFEAMADLQDGRCLICRSVPELLVVDHCHKTGRVRGLLCRECNLALGYLKDRPERAMAAAEYLTP
jgi:hypothetical protein